MGKLETVVLFSLITYHQVSHGLYSRYLGTSRLQYLTPQAPSCNKTNYSFSRQQIPSIRIPYVSPHLSTSGDKPLHLALKSQFPAAEAKDYMNPKILTNSQYQNSAGDDKNQQDEDDMDIGTRISMPMSQTSSSKGTVWMPHRLTLPSRLPDWQKESIQTLLSSEERSKIFELDAKAINCEPTCPYSIVKYFADSQYENLMSGLKFFLFTRGNPIVADQIMIFDMKSVNSSQFSATRPTKIILHGFTDVDAPGEWINLMKEAYLTALDANVLVADFSSFSLPLLFRTNLPIFASKRLAEMIMFLESDAGVSADMLHIIARSYGCHIAGMTGRLLGGKVGRITALEPADKIAIDGAPEYKVTKDDAQFVDVVHVNGKRFFFHGAQFGIQSPVGHVDIFPNIVEKGLGCPGENQSIRRYNVRFCQLGRGVKYFTNSIKYPESYPICFCQSFEMYKSGMCSCGYQKTRTFLGEYISNSTRGVYQLAAVPQQNPSFTSFRYFSPLSGK